MDRRKFVKHTVLGAASGILSCNNINSSPKELPVVLATWKQNRKAVETAFDLLTGGGKLLDAIEQGIKVPEADPSDSSVGLGGYPDRDGHVTLDACIMDWQGRFGSVMYLEHILHPISVARQVMEKTPHLYLAGSGALQFALENGFEKTELLTAAMRREWEKWKKKNQYDPMLIPSMLQGDNMLNHDTIGLLALDGTGKIAGGCSTSGLAFKMRGRVGDSPILGAGLYVDGEIGAATATGMGEEIARVCGAHLIVEQMRSGASPEEACYEAIRRIVKWKLTEEERVQACFIAVNKHGKTGAYSVHPGFHFALKNSSGYAEVESKSYFSE